MGTNSINPNMLAGPVYGLATTLPVRKLSGTEAAVADALWAPPAPPASVDADNDPSKLNATIQKDGKTIATFYTSGTMVTSNGGPLPANLQADGHGVALADARIRLMLDLVGGTVSYRHNAPPLNSTANSTANASALFTAQLAGQKAR
jgi:hypothetical protein